MKRKVINAATDVPRPSISAQQQHVTAGPTTPATTSAPIRTAIPAAGVDQDPQNSACLEGGNAPGGGSEDAEVIGAATRMVSEEGTAGVAASVARKSAGRQQKASKTAAGTSKGNKKRKSA